MSSSDTDDRPWDSSPGRRERPSRSRGGWSSRYRRNPRDRAERRSQSYGHRSRDSSPELRGVGRDMWLDIDGITTKEPDWSLVAKVLEAVPGRQVAKDTEFATWERVNGEKVNILEGLSLCHE
ncbi:hypothetical protein CYMTET_25063, partial [Cymbomonas tetramitiformis]